VKQTCRCDSNYRILFGAHPKQYSSFLVEVLGWIIRKRGADSATSKEHSLLEQKRNLTGAAVVDPASLNDWRPRITSFPESIQQAVTYRAWRQVGNALHFQNRDVALGKTMGYFAMDTIVVDRDFPAKIL
jgi:hypothetical protein